MFTKKQIELASKVNKILEKLGWEWEPERGEWCLVKDEIEIGVFKPHLISMVHGESLYSYEAWRQNHWYISEVIPILHWERLERILEEMGYWPEITRRIYGSEGAKSHCKIDKNGKFMVAAWAEIRQEAVMEAIIKLAEEK